MRRLGHVIAVQSSSMSGESKSCQDKLIQVKSKSGQVRSGQGQLRSGRVMSGQDK